jgi:hypothetical protein
MGGAKLSIRLNRKSIVAHRGRRLRCKKFLDQFNAMIIQ